MTTRLAAALNDLAATFDAAIRKAATPRVARALCTLRAEAEDKLRHAAGSYGRRSPAEIIGEVLNRIADLMGGSEVMALAKRASGPGHRDAAERKPEGEELTTALVAVGKEFSSMAERGRKAMRKLGAE